jgi:hypothetical protein
MTSKSSRGFANCRHSAIWTVVRPRLCAPTNLALSVRPPGQPQIPSTLHFSADKAILKQRLEPSNFAPGVARIDRELGSIDTVSHFGEGAGGRARLSRSLYAAAPQAVFRWNKALVALRPPHRARQRPAIVALIACAGKLLIYANTVRPASARLGSKDLRELMVATD